MAISNLASLLAKKLDPTQIRPWTGNGTLARGIHWNSQWTTINMLGGLVGVAPTAPVVPTNLTVGALAQADKAGSEQRAWLRRYGLANTGVTSGGLLLLVDRLSHQGGLSGTATGAQTTNLPTAALTRSTAGADFAALEIYTLIGATATTFTVSYTSDVGAGRTSPASAIGTTSFQSVHALLPIPMQAGDRLVKSVESVTLAATTGTAGNFGVTLFKILGAWPWSVAYPYPLSGPPEFGYPMPSVPNGACLQWLFGADVANNTTGGQVCDTGFFED